MTSDTSPQPISPLRARMIEDMSVRGFKEDTRRDYVRHVRAFAAFIGRSPDTATAEELRLFQLHQTQSGMQPPSINGAVSALRFFFTVTLDRPDLARRLTVVPYPRRIPTVLSVEEVTLLLRATSAPKYKAAFATAYGAGLRVSEVVALKVGDIDSERMLLRVEQRQGEAKTAMRCSRTAARHSCAPGGARGGGAASAAVERRSEDAPEAPFDIFPSVTPGLLGARIGATAVLHSWGSAMTTIRTSIMIVPGGGISLDGTRWVRCKPGFLLPVRVLSRLFRRLFLAALTDAHAAGRLAFFGEIEGLRRRNAFTAHLAPLKRKNWFVYAKPPFAGPEAVLAYLARYTHRVAIANSRLLAFDERGVTFRYKDYRRDGQARYRTMTLARRRVHQALPAPRSAEGLSSHPPLRAARQPRLQGQHCTRQGADRRPDAGG